MKRSCKMIAFCLCLCLFLPMGIYAADSVADAGGEYGVFGRDSSDLSVKITGETPYTVDLEQAGISGNGSNILLEMYLADNEPVDKTLSADFIYDGGKGEKKDLVKISGNGEIFVCSASVKKGNILNSRWYKVSVLVSETGEIMLYIDGYYIGKGSSGLSDIETISSVTVEASGDAYCDDLEVSRVEDVSFSPFEFRHEDREIQAGMVLSVSREIFISPYVTVDEFISGLETDAQVLVRDSDGEEVAPDSMESVEGKYFVFEADGIKPVYFKAETDIEDMTSTEAKQMKNNGKGFVWEKVFSGVGGREEEEELYHMGQIKTSQQLVADGVLTSAQASAWRDNGITFGGGRKNPIYEYYPITLESSFYYRGAETYISLDAKFLNSSGAGSFFSPLRLYADGSIKTLDNVPVTLAPETWNYISFTAYPGESPVIAVRINGELVSYVEINEILPRVESVKAYLGISGGAQWGEMWMADWQVYTGAYRSEQSAAEITAESDDEDIEINDDVIVLKKSFSAGELLNSIFVRENAEKRIVQAEHPKKQIVNEQLAITEEYQLLIIQGGIYKYYSLEYDRNVPIITFVNYTDGQSVQINSMDVLSVSVSGSQAVTMVNLYVDNALFRSLSEAPYDFDISSVGTGTHRLRAYVQNSGGCSSENSITVHVKNTTANVQFETDFESYASSVPDGFGQSSLNKGYMESGVFGDNPSKSFVLGIDKDRVQNEHTQGAWVGFDTSALPRFAFEFDAYFDGANYYSIDFKMEGITPQTGVTISDGTIRTKTASIPYSDRIWYTLKLDFDTAAHKFSLYVTDRSGNNVGTAIDCPMDEDYTPLDWIRICGPNNESVTSVFAIDNLKYSHYNDSTEIVSVGCDGAEEPIAASCKKIDAYLSKKLFANTVSADSVKLYDGETEIALSGVTYHSEKNIVSVETNEILKSNTEYTLKLTEGVKDGTGASAQTSYCFRTKKADLEFENCTITDDVFQCRVSNSSSERKNVYIIINVTEGNRIVAKKVYPYIAEPQKKEKLSCFLPAYQTGQQISVYIWDSLLYPKSYLRYDLSAI